MNQAHPVLEANETFLRPDDGALVLPAKADKFSTKCACNGAGPSRIINYTVVDKSPRQSILDGQMAGWCRL